MGPAAESRSLAVRPRSPDRTRRSPASLPPPTWPCTTEQLPDARCNPAPGRSRRIAASALSPAASGVERRSRELRDPPASVEFSGGQLGGGGRAIRTVTRRRRDTVFQTARLTFSALVFRERDWQFESPFLRVRSHRCSAAQPAQNGDRPAGV